MPRPWEYSVRRFRLMQAVMWLVLLAMLGVAYAVSRVLNMPSGQLVQVGPISLRLPDGFTIDNNPQFNLQAHDAKTGRLLVVLIQPAGRDDAGFSEERTPIEFRGLNETGTLAAGRRLSSPDVDSTLVLFIAAAQIPSSRQQVVLELQVTVDDESKLTADQTLLRRIANSVTLTGGSPTRRSVDHSNDTVVYLQSIPTRGATL